uniref:Proteasome component Ecm29 N-terminal domain-containing protein n=1 Tax=Auxenochlorella protothecoides TaxID=3075 RepID=A0A1D1ZQA1_AUXPR
MADVGQEAEALTVVLTRLASTPDEALEKLLVRLLPVVIKKLSLGDPTVQKRVLAILSHVNKRIQPLPTLRLPLAELAGVYTSPTAGPMSRNFAAVYLERAGARATPADVADVLETLIPGLARRQEAHQSMFLKLILWGLPHFDKRYASPGGEEGPPPVLADASDRAFFLSFACQLLTYQPPPASAAPADPARSVPGTSAALAALLNGAEALTAGPGALAAAKRGSLGACAAWCRDPRDLLLPCTLACAEPDDAVAERGQATLRTLGDLSAVVEEEGVVKVLMESGLGTEPVEGAAAAAPGPDAPSLASAAGASAAGAAATSHPLQSLLHPVPPAPPAALLRALGLLTRSAAAAADVPRALALVRVALASPQRRLRTAGAEFAAWVFCHAALADLAPAADPALAACLALVLDGAGETAGAADAGTRGAALRAVGTLAQRVPACLAGRVDVAAALFEALAREPAGTRALLQETLAGASQAFAGAQADAGARAQVLAVLAAHIRSPQEAARATALQWAAKVFPGEDVEARYLAVVAAGDVRGAVAAAAVDSLTPVPGTREERGLPRFLDMLGCLLRHHPALGRVGAVGADSGLSLKSLAAAVRFLERLRRSEIERMEAALPPAALASYAALLAPGLGPNAPTALQAGALRALLGALGAGAVGRRPAVDEATATALGPRAAALTAHANAPVRGLAARVAGRLHAALPGSVRDAWRRCLEQAAAGKRVGVEEALGAAAALGLVAARGVLEGQEPPPEGWVAALASCVTTGVVDPEVRLTAAQSLAFLAAAAREAGGGVAGEQTPLAGIDWSEVVAAIVPLLEPSCSQIVQQGAVGALGTLAWAVPEAGILESVAEALLGLHGRRGEALLFPTGEALCLVFGGTRLQLHHLLDIEYLGLASLDGPRGGTPGGAAPVSTERQAVQAKILEAVVGRFPDSAKAEQRAAGAAWLTALLQHVGPSPLILARLSAIQEALIPMLGEDSELVQELASRGLIETHGLASGATREELVKRLIVALSGNTHKRPAASLSGATDAANGTGTAVAGGAGGAGTKSGALLVYRELASMAAALSEPELLYHFMELALQTSATTSGPGRPTPTVTQASLNASLPRILPRLFRHRFDPNPKVQAAMSRVWLLLVDDGAALLDAQLGPLLDALLADMGQPAWRVRESAALAAAELARGRGWGDLAPRYQPLWNMGLRVLDDVKESVRAAGLALVRTLRGFALRATGTEGGADLTQGATVAAVLLPILLQGGGG